MVIKLLCDRMCTGLARWLRAAGYDTTVAGITDDDEAVIQQAIHEGRLLITKDSDFIKMDVPEASICYLRGELCGACDQS